MIVSRRRNVHSERSESRNDNLPGLLQPTLPLPIANRNEIPQREVITSESIDIDPEKPISPSRGYAVGPPSPDQQHPQQSRIRRKRKRTFLVDLMLHPLTVPLVVLTLVAFLYTTVSTYIYYYLPASVLRIPVANVDVPVPSAMEWPFIHIVNTRFMQEQGALTTLGMARFHLFMTFCFPTMLSQSSQHFFWIIKTDPEFTKTPIFDLMLQAIQSVPNHNIYLVASNNNFLINPLIKGSWKDGAECLDLLQSKIYTGNITKLHMAMALRNERPVLETRLDADDGLHMHYLKYIQHVALKRFQPALYRARQHRSNGEDLTELTTDAANLPPVPQWLYWCTRRHVEWHSSIEDSEEWQNVGNLTTGVLVPIQHDKLCVTPGMTVGYNIDVDAANVPFHSHDTLFRAVSKSSDCFSPGRLTLLVNKTAGGKIPACLVLVEDLLFCAVRSRTLTSAGMLNVGIIPAFRMEPNTTNRLWQLLDERFSITKAKVQRTQEFLIGHRKEIAYENVLGQCTTGHSCKDQAKAELQRIIDEERAA
ncbi:putative rhamnosyl transferase [Nitzschia inconspicua]|uniref:Rhamnosyl transferase n=1 Tax=Nitzschia inconspicua TaxID=303405 RepID=A0A9K3L2C9_9STRA|nr:putative rhamnosyl transferase [Nitzschia inconspicua]